MAEYKIMWRGEIEADEDTLESALEAVREDVYSEAGSEYNDVYVLKDFVEKLLKEQGFAVFHNGKEVCWYWDLNDCCICLS